MMGQTYVILLVLLLGLVVIEGRGGGRGGGARGGSRGGSRSSGSSSRSSRVSSSISSYRGPVYTKSSWKTAAAAGTLYGLMAYKRRSMYINHQNREPTVCFNAVTLHEGYGYFICPEPGQADDNNYCCGENGDQNCCTYGQKNVGAIVGGVIGGIVFLGLIIFVVCFCMYRRNRKKKPAPVRYRAKSQTVSTTTASRASSTNVYSSPVENGFSASATANGTSSIRDSDKSDKDDIAGTRGDPPPYGFGDSEPRRRTPTVDPPTYGFDKGESPQPPPYGTTV